MTKAQVAGLGFSSSWMCSYGFTRSSSGCSLRLWLDTGLPGNEVTHDNHREFVDIWSAVSADDDVRVAVIRGSDGIFCSGGSLRFLPPLVDDPARRAAVYEDIRGLVHGIQECRVPIITAIEGFCSGAGLVVGLMADISITARDAALLDAQHIAGLACGDHAPLVWPLSMGMARSRYHLLAAEPIDGEAAAAHGLVSLCVDPADLHQESLRIASRIAEFEPEPVRLTRRALNGWYRLADPIFEQGAAFEAQGFAGAAMQAVVAAWEQE